VRDRRRHRRAHAVAVERPALQCGADRREGRLGGRQAQFGDALLQRRRQCLHQTGDRFVEAAVGDHRGDHRAHADIGVGLGDLRQPVGRRQRPFEGEVIAGRAALHHHLHGTELGREILVLGIAVAGDPGCRRQQQFEGPAVAHPLGQVAVAVGVGIDEASRRVAEISLAPSGAGQPGGPISRIVSSSIRMSAGSAVPLAMSSTSPPRTIVWLMVSSPLKCRGS
jgi:hypothetical protein